MKYSGVVVSQDVSNKLNHMAGLYKREVNAESLVFCLTSKNTLSGTSFVPVLRTQRKKSNMAQNTVLKGISIVLICSIVSSCVSPTAANYYGKRGKYLLSLFTEVKMLYSFSVDGAFVHG